MKRFMAALLVCITLVAAAPASAAENATQTESRPGDFDLKTAVQRGLDANPTIMAVRSELLGSEKGIKSARGDFLAKASVNYGFTYTSNPTTASTGGYAQDWNTWALNLNLSQPIFEGFKILSSFQKAKLQRDQAVAKLFYTELSLILNIQSNFMGLLKARMDVKSSEDSVKRLQSQLKVTQAFFDVGLRPRLDLLQAEVNLANEEQNLLKAKNQVDLQVTQLNALLNLPLEQTTPYVGQLEYMPFEKDFDTCLKIAYQNRPDIQMAQKSMEIATKDADISAGDFYPHVSADFNYNQVGDDPTLAKSRALSESQENYWTAGATVSWTFFEWGSNYYDYQKALDAVEQLRHEMDNTKLEAGNEVKSNLLNIATAAERIRVARKSVEAGQEGYRMAVARYQAQVGTNTEVLDAQSDLTDAEALLNEALADYQTALANLYVSMGVKNIGLQID
ncbi:MAG: TolC family protein [Desulfovibrionaceae bacterium]